jgi:hypothetical protein
MHRDNFTFIGMEHWWNDNDKEKPKYLEKNLSQYHFVHRKPYMVVVLKAGICSDRLATNRCHSSRNVSNELKKNNK